MFLLKLSNRLAIEAAKDALIARDLRLTIHDIKARSDTWGEVAIARRDSTGGVAISSIDLLNDLTMFCTSASKAVF